MVQLLCINVFDSKNCLGEMKMDLTNKKLLLMGGGAYAKGLKKYADEKGFKMIAVGRDSDTPLSRIADEFYQIDTKDVEKVSALVKEKGIDGIFVGSSEVNIDPAIEVSERTGARFYTDRKQWDIIANKARFKEFARKNNVPVVPEFKLTSELKEEDVNNLTFPIMIKPVDSSGARGLYVCYTKEDLYKNYAEALKWSESKEIIVEKLITDSEEVFFYYTMQDGNYSLSAAFTKHKVISDSEYVNATLPIFHMYPCKYVPEFLRDVDPGVKKMFKEMGLKNGVIMLQGFVNKKGEFCFFESGFRMGGEQMYILTDYQWGINSLEMMVNYALSGKMSDEDIREKDDARFRHPCCNYYVSLKSGVIKEMNGIEEVEKMPEVLNVTVMSQPGDVIPETNALERCCLRIHVVGETKEKLAKALEKISATLKIISTKGEEMQIEHLTYDRCLKAIELS